jgi:hypothetical protein
MLPHAIWVRKHGSDTSVTTVGSWLGAEFLMKQGRRHQKLYLMGLLLFLFVAGCQVLPDKGMSCPADQVVSTGFNRPPRLRGGAYPAAILGTPWLGPKLGAHGYYYTPAEKDGIAYTCRGGTIDVAHLRIAVDWSAYLASQTYRRLMKHEAGFSYKLAVDRSRDYVQFSYPANWDSLPETQRRAAAREIALAVGPYLTYTMVTWHEILTWFGFRCTGLPTEFPSAFSWEDSYSNVLGTVVAVQALQDTEHSYDEAVTIALDREMAKLGLQPAAVSRQASESVKGRWSAGDLMMFVTIRKRNFSTGLGNGLVTPTLVPGVPECPEAEPLSYPAPTLDVLAQHGFTLTLEIEPHEWESGKIRRIACPGETPRKRISPPQDFPIIMTYIRAAATALYPEFDYTTCEDGTPPHTQMVGQ